MVNTSAVTQLLGTLPQAYYRNDNLDKTEDEWPKLEFSTRKKAVLSFYKKETLLFSKKTGKTLEQFFYLRPKALVLRLCHCYLDAVSKEPELGNREMILLSIIQ